MMLYSWFIPKTPDSSKIKPHYRDNPLPNALAALLGTSREPMDLLVSPGYLSKNVNTTKHFFDSFDSLLGQRPNMKEVPGKFGIGFMRGMATGTQEDAYLLNHWNELAIHDHSLQFCAPIFTRLDATENHSKIVFLYTVRDDAVDFTPESFSTYLSNLWRENARAGEQKHDVVAEFLSNVKVNAIAIGSSNFSDSTYFGGLSKSFSHGESDVILFESDPDDASSSFHGIVEFFQGKADENEDEGTLIPNDPPWLEQRLNVLQDSALSRVFYSGGTTPEDYLNGILREYLSGWTV